MLNWNSFLKKKTVKPHEIIFKFIKLHQLYPFCCSSRNRFASLASENLKQMRFAIVAEHTLNLLHMHEPLPRLKRIKKQFLKSFFKEIKTGRWFCNFKLSYHLFYCRSHSPPFSLSLSSFLRVVKKVFAPKWRCFRFLIWIIIRMILNDQSVQKNEKNLSQKKCHLVFFSFFFHTLFFSHSTKDKSTNFYSNFSLFSSHCVTLHYMFPQKILSFFSSFT